jgi:Mg2+ and Co2+ transporter CorA
MIMANFEHLVAMMEQITAKVETNHKNMLARLDAHHDRMMAWMNSQLEKREACLKKTESTEEIKSKSEHQEVPKEGAAEENFRALKEWNGDQHLAVGWR